MPEITYISAKTGQSWTVWEDDPEPPPLTLADFTGAIDGHVEGTARARGYNSAAHLAGYAASTVPLWAAEAQTFIAWRDAVWVGVLGTMAQVQAGEVPAPEIPALIASLPAINWPEGQQ